MSLPTLYSLTLSALTDAELIRRKVAEVAARPEFQLDSDRDRESAGLLLRLLRWLLEPLLWLLSLLKDLPRPLWWLTVIALAGVAIALIVHICWTILAVLQPIQRKGLKSGLASPRLTPQELEDAATAAETRGDFIGAIRCWFRATIMRIELAEEKPFRRGITNHELLHRYRNSPLQAPLEWFVQTIDAKWYGHEECRADDCRACRAEYSRVCGLIIRRSHAVGP